MGFKGRLADNALFLTAAAFFYDYRDVQIYGSIYTEPIDPLFGIDNVGDAEVLGAELDLSWRLTGDADVVTRAGCTCLAGRHALGTSRTSGTCTSTRKTP